MVETDTLILKVLLAILCTTTLLEIAYYLLIGTSVLKFKRKRQRLNKNNGFDESEEKPQPSVSVIICTKNEAEKIHDFLPLVLEQQYPDYEVIVVNDGSTDNTEEEIVNLKKIYKHLQFTNIPEQTIAVSHKKLAITIGIKTAKNEILIFTDADCRPWTPHWLSNMVESYTPDTEFILGYGGYYSDKHFLSKLIAYDTLTLAIEYFGISEYIKPYMAVGRNMSYKRSSFFNHKGFAGFLHIDSGDDDLLVNCYGSKKNTVIQPSIEAKTMAIPKQNLQDWYYHKNKHLTAFRHYNTKSKIMAAVEPTIRIVFWSALTATLILHCTSTFALTVVAISLVLKIFTQAIVINRTASYYKEQKFNILLIILLDIILPIITIYSITIGRCFTKTHKWR